MWIQDHIEYTSTWHEVGIDANMSLYAVLLWCLEHDSPHGFHVVVNDSVDVSITEKYKNAKLRFQSQEDAVMFKIIWTV